jgi:hypothetical protein
VTEVDIPPLPLDILKKKNNRAYDPDVQLTNEQYKKLSSNRRFNSPVELEITPKLVSEGFRVEKPSVKALAVVQNKMCAMNVFHPVLEEKVTDITTIPQNHKIINVSKHEVARPSKKRKRGHKAWFPEDKPQIYDASYTEMGNVFMIAGKTLQRCCNQERSRKQKESGIGCRDTLGV